MKKIITLITLIIVFFVSCTNNTTSPDENQNNNNNSNNNNSIGQKAYVIHTATIEVNNERKTAWLVKDGDTNLLMKLWEATIINYNGGLTIANGPTSGTANSGHRSGYFGYEIGKTGNEAFNMYNKADYDNQKKETIINEFKGVRIVKLPEKQESDLKDYKYNEKLTVAGIYTTRNLEGPQKVDQDQAIAFRPDCIFTKKEPEIDGAIFYAMQFMFDKQQKIIDTAETKFEPYEYKKESATGYYNESDKPAKWTFATKRNFMQPKLD